MSATASVSRDAVVPRATVALPTAAGWGGAQRRRLALATCATRSERLRRQGSDALAVLAYVVSRTAPTTLTVAQVASWTGLTVAEVTAAMADLQSDGRLAPGDRLDVIGPAFLEAVGLGDVVIPTATRPPVIPPDGGAYFGGENGDGADDGLW